MAETEKQDWIGHASILALDVIGFSNLTEADKTAAKRRIQKMRSIAIEAAEKKGSVYLGWSDAGDGGYLFLRDNPIGAMIALRSFTEECAKPGEPPIEFRYTLHEGRVTRLETDDAPEFSADAIVEAARRLDAMAKHHVGQIVTTGLYRETLVNAYAEKKERFTRLADVIDKHGFRHEVWNWTDGSLGVVPKEEELWREEERTSLANLPERPLVVHGRDDALAELAQRVAGGNTQVTQAPGVRGLGGVGKTTLALAYAHSAEAAERFAIRWWIPAEDPANARAALAALATQLGAAGEKTPPEEAVERLFAWFEKNAIPTLLIFDNVEDADVPKSLTPPGARSLITTRAARLKGAELVSLEIWAREVTADFLMDRTGDANRDAALALADALGGLPLAAAQAAALCDATGMDLATYLARFGDQATDALHDLIADEFPDPLARTYLMALDRAAEEAPGARDILEIMATLAPEPMPVAVFTNDKAPETLRDPVRVERAIHALRKHALVERAPAPYWLHPEDGSKAVDCLMAHRLVLRAARGEASLAKAVGALSGAFTGDEMTDQGCWPACARLSSHTAEEWCGIEWSADVSDRARYALDRAATYEWIARANLMRSKILFEAALTIAETAHGYDATQVATQLSNLANVLRDLGRAENLTRAKEALERALRIGEAARGPNHPYVAAHLSNLANVLLTLGGAENLTRAKEALKRALRIDEAAHGPDHPEVATDLSNLASALLTLGGTENLTHAKETLKRALRIDEAAHGPDHPIVATRLSNLASALLALGGAENLTRAKEVLERALRIKEASLGPDHPETGIDCVKLARHLATDGEWEAALSLARRGCDIMFSSLGPEHRHTVIAEATLAEIEGGLEGE